MSSSLRAATAVAAAYHARRRVDEEARQMDGATYYAIPPRSVATRRTTFAEFAEAAARGAAPEASPSELQVAYHDMPRDASEARFAEALAHAANLSRARRPRRAAEPSQPALVEQREDAGELELPPR